jgi:hypothetical protein
MDINSWNSRKSVLEGNTQNRVHRWMMMMMMMIMIKMMMMMMMMISGASTCFIAKLTVNFPGDPLQSQYTS